MFTSKQFLFFFFFSTFCLWLFVSVTDNYSLYTNFFFFQNGIVSLIMDLLSKRCRVRRVCLDEIPDDTVASSFPEGGVPITWHNQRCDALVSTDGGGVAVYCQGTSGPPSVWIVCSWGRVNLNSLGTKPLGLASYGDLVCTISNPCVLIDLSERGTVSMMSVFYDSETTMVNALRILRVRAPRVSTSGPIDHLMFVFCTNEGILASKSFSYPQLMRHLSELKDASRRRRAGQPNVPEVLEPSNQKLMWIHRAGTSSVSPTHEEVAINDFSLRMRPYERHYGDLVVCYDTSVLRVYQVRFKSLGAGLHVALTIHGQFNFARVSPLPSLGIAAGGSVEPARMPLPTNAPDMLFEKMEAFFTYVCFDSDTRVFVATADVDQLIVVFERRPVDRMQQLSDAIGAWNVGGESRDQKPSDDGSVELSEVGIQLEASSTGDGCFGYYVKYVFSTAQLGTAGTGKGTERPYKIVPVAPSLFAIACQRYVCAIDVLSGASTARCISPNSSEWICGMSSPQEGILHVAKTQRRVRDDNLAPIDRPVVAFAVTIQTPLLDMQSLDASGAASLVTHVLDEKGNVVDAVSSTSRAGTVKGTDSLGCDAAYGRLGREPAARTPRALRNACTDWLQLSCDGDDSSDRCIAQTVVRCGRVLCRQGHAMTQDVYCRLRPAAGAVLPQQENHCHCCNRIIYESSDSVDWSLQIGLVCPMCAEILCGRCGSRRQRTRLTQHVAL